MSAPWETFQSPDHLYSDEVVEQLLEVITDRAVKERERKLVQRQRVLQLQQAAEHVSELISPDLKQRARAAIDELMKSERGEPAPDHPYGSPPGPLSMPRVGSCTTAWGPYLQWGDDVQVDGTRLTHLIAGHRPISTDEPRRLHPALALGPGRAGLSTRGAGCWVQAAHAGQVTFDAEFFFGAHNNVTTYVFGSADSTITFSTAVTHWTGPGRPSGDGNASPLLDRTHTIYSHQTYIGVEHDSNVYLPLTHDFMAVGGGFYFLSAEIEIESNAYGAAHTSAEVNAVLNPFHVCMPDGPVASHVRIPFVPPVVPRR